MRLSKPYPLLFYLELYYIYYKFSSVHIHFTLYFNPYQNFIWGREACWNWDEGNCHHFFWWWPLGDPAPYIPFPLALWYHVLWALQRYRKDCTEGLCTTVLQSALCRGDAPLQPIMASPVEWSERSNFFLFLAYKDSSALADWSSIFYSSLSSSSLKNTSPSSWF